MVLALLLYTSNKLLKRWKCCEYRVFCKRYAFFLRGAWQLVLLGTISLLVVRFYKGETSARIVKDTSLLWSFCFPCLLVLLCTVPQGHVRSRSGSNLLLLRTIINNLLRLWLAKHVLLGTQNAYNPYGFGNSCFTLGRVAMHKLWKGKNRLALLRFRFGRSGTYRTVYLVRTGSSRQPLLHSHPTLG